MLLVIINLNMLYPGRNNYIQVWTEFFLLMSLNNQDETEMVFLTETVIPYNICLNILEVFNIKHLSQFTNQLSRVKLISYKLDLANSSSLYFIIFTFLTWLYWNPNPLKRRSIISMDMCTFYLYDTILLIIWNLLLLLKSSN